MKSGVSKEPLWVIGSRFRNEEEMNSAAAAIYVIMRSWAEIPSIIMSGQPKEGTLIIVGFREVPSRIRVALDEIMKNGISTNLQVSDKIVRAIIQTCDGGLNNFDIN